jgi:hypothetical protein
MEIEKIKQAIKAQKWDKASYEYAVDAMNPWIFPISRMYSLKLKKDLIERFYADIQDAEKWARIKDFTTFKNI